MKKVICNIIGWYYTVRFYNTFLLEGYNAIGHNLEYTGEQHSDHWNMQCTRCGEDVCSEIGPDATPQEF